MNDQTIHEAVRAHYSAIASATAIDEQTSACCGTGTQPTACCGDSNNSMAGCGCGSNSGLYNVTMLDGLPEDAIQLSLGCGDPVTIASLKLGETVLDLGSGGGIDCFMAAKRVGESGKVIGVDMTPEMLAKANANKSKIGVSNVEFRQGQIEALPVADSSVDVIMSNCVINLSPDKPTVFREAFRVLKPGGRISISDIVTEGDFSTELRAQVDKWAECVTGAIDISQYTRMMHEAGFVDIQVLDKADAGEIISVRPGMPRIYSARITARKL